MSVPPTADEIFEMAEQIERNGARFYRRAAQGFTDSRARQQMLDLAAMEDQHEKAFAGMRTELLQQEREPRAPDPYGEAILYVRGMADGHVFDVGKDPSERLTGKETMEEILRTAIGLEKDSIVFYLGIKEIVLERLSKQRIDDIIKEEMGHIAVLSQEMAALGR
jgi:rubrerythrin